MLRKRVVLGELEARVLNVLWERGASSVQDVVDALPQEQERHYNTCSTVLSRLAKRGLVSRRREGRAHRFVAVVTRDELGSQYLELLRRDVFGGSVTGMVAALLGSQRLEQRDAERIRDLLEELEPDDDPGSAQPADEPASAAPDARPPPTGDEAT